LHLRVDVHVHPQSKQSTPNRACSWAQVPEQAVPVLTVQPEECRENKRTNGAIVLQYSKNCRRMGGGRDKTWFLQRAFGAVVAEASLCGPTIILRGTCCSKLWRSR
jgi:hypothetical protein